MNIFVVSDTDEVLGAFTSEAAANAFAEDAQKALGGAYVGVQEITLDTGYVRNPWTGKECEAE